MRVKHPRGPQVPCQLEATVLFQPFINTKLVDLPEKVSGRKLLITEDIHSLQRRPKFVLLNTIIPCCAIASLGLLVFFIPAESGEKVSFGMNVLLAFAVFLLMIAENMPQTSLHLPYIGEN